MSPHPTGCMCKLLVGDSGGWRDGELRKERWDGGWEGAEGEGWACG